MYYINILTDQFNSALYTGVTNSLERRTIEHISEVNDGFTKKYKTHKLIYYEEFGDIRDAIKREKQLKGWRREKKARLIIGFNPY